MSLPAWQTGELEEEWIESSPSPPSTSVPLPTETLRKQSADSISAKRGSLRSLGHSAARALPPSRNVSIASIRVVSGHGEGRVLSEKLDEGNIPADLPSPPESRSSSGEGGLPAGTCVVKDGVDDDRGAHLARKGKDKDMFGPSALEKMFQPPSPPHQTTPLPESLGARRASHPYAPVNPSRLSKSITPSTVSGSTPEASIVVDESQMSLGISLPVPTDVSGEESSYIIDVYGLDAQRHGRDEQSNPIGKGQDYPFTFEDPHRSVTRSPSSFDSLEPTHSTLHQVPAQSSSTPGLRLFRSTYDTYTREHLSAMVDSIAIEASPSPGASESASLRWTPNQSPSDRSPSERSGSRETFSSDETRSSKRMRLSPSSPGVQKGAGVRDWGAEATALMNRIRARAAESNTSASRSPSLGLSSDHASVLYVDCSPSPSPPDQQSSAPDRPTHRSNPSTTSSDYLRRAEELMARVRARAVSVTDTNPESSLEGTAKSASPSDWGFSPSPERPVQENDVSPSPAAVPSAQEPPAQGSIPSTTSSDYLRRAEELMARVRATGVSETESNSGTSPGATGSSRFPSGTSSEWGVSLPIKHAKNKTAGSSPRRLLRRLSASEEIQRARDDSSGDDGPTAAPKQLLDERQPAEKEAGPDVNRAVSATTVTTATTTSFVKHAGPRSKTVQMIKPDDVADIVSDRVGKMRFDKASMRWVRESLSAVDESGEARGNRSRSEESEDVFAGIDTWGSKGNVSMPPVTVEGEDAPSSSSDSELDDENVVRRADTTHIIDEGDSDLSSAMEASPPKTAIEPSPTRPIPQHASSAPAIISTPTQNLTAPLPIRSALRNAKSVTPGPAKRTQWHESVTPAPASGSRRSVSFSDGRQHGRIKGLHGDDTSASGADEDWFQSKDGPSWMPSARTKRIGNILEGVADMHLNDATPSKVTRSLVVSPDSVSEVDPDETIRPDNGPLRSFRERADANATFLTECSFGVSHDKLVQLITDVYGSEPYWDKLTLLDLRHKGADSVARLKEFLPDLEEVNLNDNKISYLSGMPSGIRSLSIARNRLTSMASVDHLKNLQYLDVSGNQLDSVTQLSCLKHLRELRADDNAIVKLEGVMQLDGLIRLSVRGNKITSLDLGSSKWARLETLDLADNRISRVSGLELLVAVQDLTLDHNNIGRLAPARPMPSMRVIRISGNELSSIDLALFPKLRTFYADNNDLISLDRTSGSSHIENLSMRNQRRSGLRLSQKELENVKRLYLSGNPLTDAFFPAAPLYALAYLEAAACNLRSLPRDMAHKMPSLRILNVNYNYLERLDELQGMKYLRKVSVVGARLGGSGGQAVLKGLKNLSALEEVDLRMNPSTLNFYFPLMVVAKAKKESTESKEEEPAVKQNPLPSVTLANIRPFDGSVRIPEPDYKGKEWTRLDARFRKTMPDEWYGKRLVYRGLVMGACSSLRVLDGVDISEGERRKAGLLIDAAVTAGI